MSKNGFRNTERDKKMKQENIHMISIFYFEEERVKREDEGVWIYLMYCV
jgi:hypothetical protein